MSMYNMSKNTPPPRMTKKASHEIDEEMPTHSGTELADEDISYQEDLQDYHQSGQPYFARMVAMFLGFVVLVLFAVGSYVFMVQNGFTLRNNGGAGGGDVQNIGTVTVDMLIQHNKPGDCWVVYHGEAYDLTKYEHPGPQRLVTDGCGLDQTQEYDAEHPKKLLKTISSFKVGTLSTDGSTTIPTAGGGGGGGTQTGGGPGPTPPMKNCGGGGGDDDDDSSSNDSSDEEDPCNMNPPVMPPTPAPAPIAPGSTPAPVDLCPINMYAPSDIAGHNQAGDCWHVYYGVVYDLTNYNHPGGKGSINRRCGMADATADYEKYHKRRLLVEENMKDYVIGRAGTVSGTEQVPCDEVQKTAV